MYILLLQDFPLDLDHPQMVPIGYICDELDIETSGLAKKIHIDQIETLLLKMNPNFEFTAQQLQFMKLVSVDIDDPLWGLLNILCIRSDHDVALKCILTEMISFIYHETDDEEENQQNEQYDLQFIQNICDIFKISKDVLNEIDLTMKQRLNIDSKFETIFMRRTDS